MGLFPDTVSARAAQHAHDLASIARAGRRAAALFLIQRGDCPSLAPCAVRDPAYAAALADAADAGVRLIGLAGGVRYEESTQRLLFDYHGPAPVLLPPAAVVEAAAAAAAAKKARNKK